jgi:hypothetical protein
MREQQLPRHEPYNQVEGHNKDFGASFLNEKKRSSNSFEKLTLWIQNKPGTDVAKNLARMAIEIPPY